jgi:hypothetical protein
LRFLLTEYRGSSTGRFGAVVGVVALLVVLLALLRGDAPVVDFQDLADQGLLLLKNDIQTFPNICQHIPNIDPQKVTLNLPYSLHAGTV